MNVKLAAAMGDTTVSQQYLSTFRRSERFDPEFALLRAILEDAVHCYEKYRWARNRSGRENFREVEAWIMGTCSDWIFSFESVCQLLGLDPTYVRHNLVRLNETPVAPGKTRQRSRRRAA
jgi:hypothetical protein